MEIYQTIADLKQALKIVKNSGHNIGLVPTMGNLHDGHLALVNKAKEHCDFVVTTIFVNPTQFGPNEDLENYPSSFDDDIAALSTNNCDAIFAPTIEEIYPDGPVLETLVTTTTLSKLHCGANRPGHFDGVCTVVTKLFNICQPDKAYFGEKDYQQLTIIKKMVVDLNLALEIIGIPTTRDASGLALSSRNSYLSQAQKKQATILYQCLHETVKTIKYSPNSVFSELEQSATELISSAGLDPEYFTICNARTLLPAKSGDKDLVILVVAKLGNTRLIDNLTLKLG